MGQSSSPTNPTDDDDASPGNDDMRVGWHEFGIEDEHGEEAIKHGEPLMSFKPLKVRGHPVVGAAPTPINIKDDGSAEVMYSVMNPTKMMNPNGSKYKGEIKNMPVRLRPRKRKTGKNWSYDNIALDPFKNMQQNPPGIPDGGMGGM